MLGVSTDGATLVLDMGDAITGDAMAKLLGMGVAAEDVQQALMDFPEQESIRVRLNSPGGSVFEGTAIYNALAGDPRPVEMRVTGLAASMASIVAMAGDDIVMEPGSLMMLHEPRVGLMFDATADDLESQAKMLGKVSESMLSIYDARTGDASSREELRGLMAAETWLTGAEAVEAGLATEVGTHQRAAESDADASWHTRRGAILASYKRAPDSVAHGGDLGWLGPSRDRLVAALRKSSATGVTVAQALTSIRPTRAARPQARGTTTSGTTKESTMDPEILKTLGLGPEATNADVLAAMKAEQAKTLAMQAEATAKIEEGKLAAAAAEAVKAAEQAKAHDVRVKALAAKCVPASREILISMCWHGSGDDRAPNESGYKQAEELLAKNPSMRVSSYTAPVAELRSEDDLNKGSKPAVSHDSAPVFYKMPDGQRVNLTAFSGATHGDHRKVREKMYARAKAIPEPSPNQLALIKSYEETL